LEKVVDAPTLRTHMERTVATNIVGASTRKKRDLPGVSVMVGVSVERESCSMTITVGRLRIIVKKSPNVANYLPTSTKRRLALPGVRN
jgi:hypothetical protein